MPIEHKARSYRYGPLQAAHQLLAADEEIVNWLNAIERRLGRTISDIVLRMCIEHYFPDGSLPVRAPGATPEGSHTAMMDYIRKTKHAEGGSLAKIIKRAVQEWIIANCSRIDVSGRAVFIDDETRIAARDGEPVPPAPTPNEIAFENGDPSLDVHGFRPFDT